MHGSHEGRLDTYHQEHTFDVLGTCVLMCQTGHLQTNDVRRRGGIKLHIQ